MLVNRVKKNSRKLRSWLKSEGVSCYRLYDHDIPEVPLAIDWYEGRLHIAQYARNSEDGDGSGFDWVGETSFALASALEVSSSNIFIKKRERGRGGAQYGRMDTKRNLVEVCEGGNRFLVNLTDYLDTGLFLDHRNTRKMVGKEALGTRFLNLFAYTGAFSVYAAAGGATQTVTVDMSNTYLDWARDNMHINGHSGEDHRFIRDDVMGALDGRQVQGEYDLVVFDPPTVSKSKSMKRDWDVQRDHSWMIQRILEICNAGGVIYFSTNFRGFKLNDRKIECSDMREITEQTIPPDFRNSRVHRCWRIVK